jgi:hypothetical protein
LSVALVLAQDNFFTLLLSALSINANWSASIGVVLPVAPLIRLHIVDTVSSQEFVQEVLDNTVLCAGETKTLFTVSVIWSAL